MESLRWSANEFDTGVPPERSRFKRCYHFHAETDPSSIAFVDMLNAIRFGKTSVSTARAFRQLARTVTYEDGIEPTELQVSLRSSHQLFDLFLDFRHEQRLTTLTEHVLNSYLTKLISMKRGILRELIPMENVCQLHRWNGYLTAW